MTSPMPMQPGPGRAAVPMTMFLSVMTVGRPTGRRHEGTPEV